MSSETGEYCIECYGSNIGCIDCAMANIRSSISDTREGNSTEDATLSDLFPVSHFMHKIEGMDRLTVAIEALADAIIRQHRTTT